MGSALWGTWRVPCSGVRISCIPSVTLRSACRDLRVAPCNSYNKRLISSLRPWSKPNIRSSVPPLPFQRPRFIFPFTRFNHTAASDQSARADAETLPRDQPLSDTEIRSIFGRSNIPVHLGNRVLGVLHARRLEGTLDLDLPADITRAVPQSQIDAALQWLRENHSIDEDAAILARIEREDYEAEQKLVRRAEQLGLYKPQSGSYEAELGEENSVYGKSVLKEAREQNERRLLDEQELKRRKWLEGEHEDRERLHRQIQGNTSLQEYQEAALAEGIFVSSPGK